MISMLLPVFLFVFLCLNVYFYVAANKSACRIKLYIASHIYWDLKLTLLISAERHRFLLSLTQHLVS